jgi:mitochondrial protein import protein ZIM17
VSNRVAHQPRRTPQFLTQIKSPSSSINTIKPGVICARNLSGNSSGNELGFRSLTDRSSPSATDALYAEQNSLRRGQEAMYQITFTCKPCGHRSSHQMSKHGYHSGTVLIRCPSCTNRHVISDHLQIFMDKKSTLEDILREKGEGLTKGYLDGDVELWKDGTIRTDGIVEKRADRPFEDTR